MVEPQTRGLVDPGTKTRNARKCACQRCTKLKLLSPYGLITKLASNVYLGAIVSTSSYQIKSILKQDYLNFQKIECLNSNPGLLDNKRECNLCALRPPTLQLNVILASRPQMGLLNIQDTVEQKSFYCAS